MLAYLDHLEARDELDLEAATEFLVLIAALLELKSRLMLPGEEVEELDELAPAEAAERAAGADAALRALPRRRGLAGRAQAAAEALLYRAAPLPDELRRRRSSRPRPSYDPAVLGAALGGLLRTPPPIDLGHMAMPRVTLGERARAPARAAAARHVLASTRRCEGADRVTVAVTAVRAARALQARRGRLGAGRAVRPDHGARRGAHDAAAWPIRPSSRRCCSSSPEPVSRRRARDAAQHDEEAVPRRCASCATAATAAAWCCARSPAAGRSPRTRTRRRPRGGCSPPAHAGAHPGPGRDAVDRRLPAAGLAARGGAHPRRRVGVRDRARWPSAA